MILRERRCISPIWQLARLESPGQTPAAADWMPAAVPGAVQLDWAAAHGLPDVNHGRNVALYDGLEDSHWLYRTAMPAITRAPGARIFLTTAGLDFEAEVRIAGRPVRRHRGLQTPMEIEVTELAAGTPVEILFFPAPKRHPQPADRTQASHVTKPAMSYGWDWHPRLIPLGLCHETEFEVRPATSIADVDFHYELTDDLGAAAIEVAVRSDPPGAAWTWRLRDAAGTEVLAGTGTASARLERPRLWWTHDHGEPHRYTLEVALAGGETVRRHVGLRRVRLVMYPGAWDEHIPMPASRNHPPFTLELNGRRIFAKGTNWVAPDLFPGRITGETYRPLLRLAQETHFNLLRCWGGAAAPREEFFDQCDELGLLVWQEFPLACNLYPDTQDYLRLLDTESRAMIRRIRPHPCLALWSGGNELFNAWSRMTDQSLPLRLLNRNCYDLDPATPFIPTSPLGGVGHGDYRFLHEGRDIFHLFQGARGTAYTEFGCPGASPAEYLREFIPADELWPARPGTSWETHHGLRAWEADETTWLCLNAMEELFGPLGSLEDTVAKSEWLQGEGYKAVYEEARRQQPRCAMALNWCFNEPWPTAANNSLVNWPARPKPALAAVRAACRPVLASARIPRFQWRLGERFACELWLLNDTAAAWPGGVVRAELLVAGRRELLGEWAFDAVPPQGALPGPTVGAALPAATAAREFVLELTAGPRAAWSSRYRLSLRG